MPDTTKLSHAFDAGNYDAAYTSEDLQTALNSYTRAYEGPYYHAYVLGFFSSYELNEVPIGNDRDDYVRAHQLIGSTLRDLGIAVDPLEQS